MEMIEGRSDCLADAVVSFLVFRVGFRRVLVKLIL